MLLITYATIAVCNACVWSALVVLLGASTGRALGAFALVWALTFAMMLFMGGANIASHRKPYYWEE